MSPSNGYARCSAGVACTISGPAKVAAESPTFVRTQQISQRPRMIPRAGKSIQLADRRISISWRRGSQKRPSTRPFSRITDTSSSCLSLSAARVNENVMRTTLPVTRSIYTAPTAAAARSSFGRTFTSITSMARSLVRIASESEIR